MELIVLIGGVLGLALGKSKFNGKITFGMGLAYTLFMVPWQLVLLTPDGDWSTRLSMMYARVYWAAADLMRNQPVRDSIIFLVVMYTLYWLASLLAGYGLTRKGNPWAPLMALGIMVLVVEYTVELYRNVKVSGGTYSFLYLFFCLMLMGRLYFLRSRREWEHRGGTVELEVGYDLGRGVLVSALVLALVAWNLPALVNVFQSNDPTRERISKEWQAIRDRINKATNTLKSPAPVVVEGFGNNLFLGSGTPLGDAVVFTARPVGQTTDTRVYWASRTYDTYLNGQWVNTISSFEPTGPGKPDMKLPEWNNRAKVTFTFTSMVQLLQTLYYPDQPLSINIDTKAILAKNANGEADFNAFVMDPPLRAGQQYTVTASIPQPNVQDMRDAGVEYPDWVKSRYLQLPDNFSAKVADLAKQIAGEEKTPYDKANAITQYLRRTITYSETISPPPGNKDPIEWFLFDSRTGFCNYYATSEVLMLRSLGVPARLVAGYAPGKFDSKENLYTIIGKDSHAWPEVYFPNQGWVIFEPTVSQSAIVFPATNESNTSDVTGGGGQAVPPTPDPRLYNKAQEPPDDAYIKAHSRNSSVPTFVSENAPYLAAGLVVLLLAVALVLMEMRRRKTSTLPLPAWFERTLDERGINTPDWMRSWSRESLRTPMEKLFMNVGVMLRIWGQKPDRSQTPAEQVNLLVGLVPSLDDSASALLEEYQRAAYSRVPPDLSRAKRAVDDLRVTGLRSWVFRLAGLEQA